MRRSCEVVEVELAKRAVEVIGAADRSPRLHPRELLHRHRRESAHLVAVHPRQRVQQHRRQLLARHRLTAGATAGLALLECRVVELRPLVAVAERRPG